MYFAIKLLEDIWFDFYSFLSLSCCFKINISLEDFTVQMRQVSAILFPNTDIPV